MDDWDAATSAARSASASLRVGFTSATTNDLALTAAAAFGRAHPGWRVAMTQLRWNDPTAPLRTRDVDVALLRHPVPDLDVLHAVEVFREPRIVALPEHHPLAARSHLRMDDLLEETFVPLPEGPWRDYWLCLDQRHGHPVRLTDPVSGPEEWAAAISAGYGIAVTAASTATYYARPGLTFRPLQDGTASTVLAVCRADDRRVEVRSFLRACGTARPTASAAPSGPAPEPAAPTVQPAQRAAGAATDVLRVAVSAEADPVQQQLLTSYSAAHPATPIATTPTTSTSSRVDALLAGHVHAAFVRLSRSPSPELGYRHLSRTPLLLAVPERHRLTAVPRDATGALPLEHLHGQPLAFYRRAQNPWWYDDVLGLLVDRGAQPRIVHRGLWAYDVLPVVAAGDALALIGRDTAAAIALPGVVYLRLQPAPVIDLGLLWRHEHRPTHLDRFLDLAGTFGTVDWR
jgi:DNA-binding transcriptional LysR family regulator